MRSVIYDESFDGLLTAIFDIYTYGFKDSIIVRQSAYQKNIFESEHCVITDLKKSRRVWKGLQQKISRRALEQLYRSFFSEIKGFENTILDYIQYIFRTNSTIEYDYSYPAVLTVTQTANKVYREKHRMEAFVRFQLTKDGLYYSTVQPDFNVLPLLINHFEKRYADQRWMIYDMQRKYGIYYDLNTTEIVEMIFSEHTENGKDIARYIVEEEFLYQQLWKQYFDSVNIKARKNMKLHIQHMPKRYWKFLPEKNPTSDGEFKV